jgi:hypothetical protein
VCTPSRAAIMTGRYPIAYGLQSYVIDPAGVDYGLALNETLLPQLLKAGGNYTNYAVGKWHLGMSRWEYTPTFRGFDFFHGYYSGGQDYFTHIEADATWAGYDLHIDRQPNCGPNCSVVDWANKGTYSTYLYSQTAAQLIAAHDPATPMFMYLAYQAVHSPNEVPPQYEWPYNTSIPNAQRRNFAGMLSCLDEGIGNVTAALEAAGMLNNTLVVFVADNGGPICCDSYICGDCTGSSNFPLRGGKHSLYQGGHRLTGAVWGNGLFAGGGVNRTGLMHHSDWLPTLLEAASIPYTPSPAFPLHGTSAWPMIARGAASNRSEVLINIDPLQMPFTSPASGNAALLFGNYKLMVGEVGPPWSVSPPGNAGSDASAPTPRGGRLNTATSAVSAEGLPAVLRSAAAVAPWPLANMTVALYDLATDEQESNNIAAANPAIVSQLMARLTYWATQVQVPPLFCGDCLDPLADPRLRNGTWTPWLD